MVKSDSKRVFSKCKLLENSRENNLTYKELLKLLEKLEKLHFEELKMQRWILV